MDNLLPPNLYGVDVAIARLRPGASYQLEGTRFTIWEDPSGKPAPSWEEVMAQVTKDMEEAERISAAHKEANAPVAVAVDSFSIPPELVRPRPGPSADELVYTPPPDRGTTPIL